MKNYVKLLSILTAASMLAGCSSSGSTTDTSTTDTSTDDTAAEVRTEKIGILQYTEHPALDASYEGFVDYLKENGFTDDNFDYKNAQNEQSNCTTIAQTFVNDKVDMIYAIATPAAEAAYQATKDDDASIPIIVSAVTDPAASGLVESNDKSGTNVAGASDLTPVESQIDLLKEMMPDASKIAIMYCNAEDNSRIQAEMAEEACDKTGLEYQVVTVTDSNQIQQAVESVIGKVDAIYVPTDNLLAAGMTTLSQVATENGIPVICGEEGMVESGGLATTGIDYYELGRLAGEQALMILNGESKPEDMAIAYYPSEQCELIINQNTADKLGIEIPDSVKDRASFITEEE